MTELDKYISYAEPPNRGIMLASMQMRLDLNSTTLNLYKLTFVSTTLLETADYSKKKGLMGLMGLIPINNVE